MWGGGGRERRVVTVECFELLLMGWFLVFCSSISFVFLKVFFFFSFFFLLFFLV